MMRPPGSFSSPVEAEEGARRTRWELVGVRCVALPASVAFSAGGRGSGRRERGRGQRQNETNERWGRGSGDPRGAATVYCGYEFSLVEVRSSIRASQPGLAERRFSYGVGTAEMTRARLTNNKYLVEFG
jgi:hypothetical protein